MARPIGHLQCPVFFRRIETRREGRVVAAKAPASKHLGKALHHGLVVGRDRLPCRIALWRTVIVQLHQSNRKQLQHFACVVLVRHAPGRRVFLVVAEHVEVIAHRWLQGHISQQRAIVAKRVLVERVHPEGECVGVLIRGDVRYHHDLGQGECDAGAQAGVTKDQVLPDRLVDVLLLHPATSRPNGCEITGVSAPRRSELAVEPHRRRAIDDVVDISRCTGAEARLGEEPCGIDPFGIAGCRWCDGAESEYHLIRPLRIAAVGSRDELVGANSKVRHVPHAAGTGARAPAFAIDVEPDGIVVVPAAGVTGGHRCPTIADRSGSGGQCECRRWRTERSQQPDQDDDRTD
ncbi:MAG: hypothetical protein BWZ07_02961 [Alphaproteobacteria bacterium ADurb.BinA280]|nr:MAG: hypothetical protein BWZ07_02961 [Alphaproteobacteria bacterium ADurb.BinA280]